MYAVLSGRSVQEERRIVVKYKELWESTKRELGNLKSGMYKRSMTVASIAICLDKIDDTEFDKLKYDFYEEKKLNNIRFEWLSENSITIIGPNGLIGVADDFLRERGWKIEYADLVVLRRPMKGDKQ